MVSSTTQQESSPDTANKLLSLAHVILSSGPLHQTLTVTIEFFQTPISVLMTYSTEGTCIPYMVVSVIYMYMYTLYGSACNIHVHEHVHDVVYNCNKIFRLIN